MNFKKLGNTDLKVSTICLGTMTWGEQNSQKEAFEQMNYALDCGVNFFDAAEIYPSPCKEETYGETERIIGNWFNQNKSRDKVILASKIAGPGLPWIRNGGQNFSEQKIKKALDDVHPSVREEAKELKNILKESNTKFGNLLTNSKKQSYQDLGDLIIKDADSFIKQRFASFNNASFKFDPTSGTIGKAAKEEMKKIIKGNKDLKKEVANRILARAGSKEFGRLSILSNWRLEIKKHFDVSKNCFFPKPKINSTVLSFKPVKNNKFNIKNPKNIETVTRVLFSNRRKMINKNFAKLFRNNKAIAEELNLNLNQRPEELSNEMFYKITMKYEELAN